MAEPIVSIDTIKQQAAEAAKIYTDINDACPYPFFTEAGRVFKAEFMRLRLVAFAAQNAAAKNAAQKSSGVTQ